MPVPASPVLCSSSGGIITEPFEVTLDRLGARHFRRGAIVFPLPTSMPEEVTSHWRRLARGLGSRALIVDRPIALALGLVLSAETDRAHLLIEVTTDFVEISVVFRGAVIDEHLIRGEPESWATLIEMVGAVLIEVDPDHELDIREEGLHLVARDPESELLARLLANGLGIPVLITDTECHPVLLGAAQIVETISQLAWA